MKWNGAPLPGQRVEIREWVIPGPGTLYASGSTDSAGRFAITGVPVKGNLSTYIAEQNGYVFVGYGIYASCGGRVVDLGDQVVRRAITGLSVDNYDTVPPGPLKITWTHVQSATRYCAGIYNTTDQQEVAPEVCTTTASWTTPTLVSGKRYSLRLTGYAGDLDIAELAEGNIVLEVR